MHAPGGEGRPPIDARGAGFVGVNLYVQLGRGRDYAWSATSAGQDNIDTFALRAVRRARTTASAARCEPIEVLEKTVAWTPTLGRPDARRLADAARRAHEARARRGARHDPRQAGDLHELRSTYFHEVDSAAGFMDFNTPTAITGPRVLPAGGEQDRLHVQLVLRRLRADRVLQLGREPACAPARIDHDLPVAGALRSGAAGTRTRWSSQRHAAVGAPAGDRPALPRQLEQQAGARLRVGRRRTPTRRSTARRCCPERVKRGDRGRAQADAAGPDRRHGGRGHGRPARALRAAARAARHRHAEGRAAARGGRRRCARGGAPAGCAGRRPRRRLRARRRGRADGRLVAAAGCSAQFEPVLGPTAMDKLDGRRSRSTTRRTTTASTSARPTRAPGTASCARTCAACSAARCAAATRASTAARGRAAALPARAAALARRRRSTCRARELYGGDAVCPKAGKDGDQWCFDAVRQRPVGGATQPLIHWINRPTYQQAVEIAERVGR